MNFFSRLFVTLALFICSLQDVALAAGTIRIIRVESFNPFNREPTIWLDEQLPIDLKINEPVEVKVEPGSHTLAMATRGISKSQGFMQRREEKIEVAEGELVNIEIEWKVGLIVGKHEMKLTREVPSVVQAVVAQSPVISQKKEDHSDATNKFTQPIAAQENRPEEANKQGVVTFPNGARYEGMLVNGSLSGRGILTWSDGSRYEGEFRDGNRTGRGVYTWPNGNRYEGEFLAGRISGKGIFIWPNGNRYEGNFVDALRSGKGVFAWSDGRRYQGDFRNDLLHGSGELTWSDGRRYVGEFANGTLSGKGVYTWPDGRRYIGDFANGLFNGKGTLSFPSGNRYEGEFVNAQKSGSGVFTLADGTRHPGIYRNDKLINENNSQSKITESASENTTDTGSPWLQILGSALGAYVGARQQAAVPSSVPSMGLMSSEMDCDVRRTTMGANTGMNQNFRINCR